MTRNLALRLYLLILLAVASTGCDLVQGIFKAGFIVGLLVVGLTILLVLFVIVKIRR